MAFVLLNKPFRVLCQFTDDGDRQTLADYVDVPDVYAAGRLDLDSEGLLALTSDGRLQASISEAAAKTPKTYWVQVEGVPEDDQLRSLTTGVILKDGPARAREAVRMEQPADLWDRNPPIRVRPSVPDSWISITLDQGRNRQVRRMTAAVGLPTLRLIRYAIGPWTLEGLAPGEVAQCPNSLAWRQLRSFRRRVP